MPVYDVARRGSSGLSQLTRAALTYPGAAYYGGKMLKRAAVDTYKKIAKKRKATPSPAVKEAFRQESALTTRGALCKKTGKIPRSGSKKTVKVSKSLRKKIGKVIEEKKIAGSWTQLSYGFISRPPGNEQNVTSMTYKTGYADFNETWNFLPEDILHCASVLFNEKPDSQNIRGITDSLNLGNNSTTESLPSGQGVIGNDAKFHLKDSFASYHMKNNTQQTVKITVYTVAIKQKQTFFTTTIWDTGAGPSNGQITAIQGPIQVWANSLSTATGQNPLGAGIDFSGIRPHHDPKFNQVFKHERCEIILEPGQTTTFNVQGPKDIEMNFQKYWLNGKFMNLQNYCRGVMFIVQNDLIQGTGENAGSVGRYRLSTYESAQICIEKKLHYSIALPESTGSKLSSTTGAPAELNMRKPCFAYRVYNAGTPAGQKFRTDEENPVIPEV